MSEQTLEGHGTADIAAAPDVVWSALLDPDVLHALIPGTERVDRDGDRYEAWLSYGAGRMQARYHVALMVAELTPPASLSLSGHSEGKLGWGRATAVVTLQALPAGRTKIGWRYEGVIGGPVAMLGGFVLRSAARVFVGRFFQRLDKRLAH